MVKILFSFLLIFSSLGANSYDYVVYNEPEEESQLTQKIKSFINIDIYDANKEFINIVFSPESDFYRGDIVNVVKVVTTLKENGLLKLFFDAPRELNLHFKTNGSPLFFVKLMSDTLRNIGYYRYVTTASNFDGLEFTWSISLKSEYATDPLVLQKELRKIGCKIVDLNRITPTEWSYRIDMVDGFLNLFKVQNGENIKLKRSLYAHWLNTFDIQTLTILSSRRNNWYPYIAYYDSTMQLLEVIKRDVKTKKMVLNIPQFTKYMKISDIYTLKNIKDGLTLYPKSSQ